ncbi:DNA polymerase Y family protein [Streptomyces sp. SP17BM10]|uniref:DNA polymerase Y family protein n=1 Tax=Streptomyces sp. SP17BM10 TaxID=3002530 RepID=UPI002E7A3D82|nr:DNA polymerase Y family protein [Streptomyces sp. SP17BM10]MEE1783126.1 DNA polymerase Y family protein [Streptomyces sp. SP17BM10]
MTRVLVGWIPDWPVVAVLGAEPDPGRLAAVAERARILAASGAARAAGVRGGQKVRSAQALVADLEVFERDLDAEAKAFEPVADAVGALAAHLEVVRPGVLALAAAGAARFHGGEEVLAERVMDAVEAIGHPCRVGIADGLFAARLAARAQRIVPAGESARFLAAHPVAELGDGRLADLLGRLGLVTLGQFAALPAASVAERFGHDGVLAHRLARGLEARPVVARPPGADLTVEERFEQPVMLAEPLAFTARGLAQRLHAGLAGAGLACERVEVEVECADGTTASRAWRHEGVLSVGAVADRVRWQLQAWQQRAVFDEDAGGVVALRLLPDGLVRDPGRQLSLEDGDQETRARAERAIARVQAILGHHAPVTVELAGGRAPADRVVRTPWGDAHRERRADGPWPGRLPAPSPTHVPARPRPVRLLDADGRDVQVSARAEIHHAPVHLVLGPDDTARVTGWAGPWPEQERWWDPEEARRTARLQVTVEDGRALLLAVTAGRWHLEGDYDT